MTGGENEANNWLAVEAEFFGLARQRRAGAQATRGPIFILGSPRTGSTFFYQSLVAGFDLPYIANLTNDRFAQTPIVGLSIQAALPGLERISATSTYGKVAGALQPSEGSAVMRRWFGGGHPSELVSAEVIAGEERHMVDTFAAAHVLSPRPLVIKNAWNCFRIAALSAALVNSCFIWIRRDLVDSAVSDLAARYATKGTPDEWNSATPRNIEALRRRPYWEQVVENQFEFARAIEEAFAVLPAERRATVWYEELVKDPRLVLEGLGRELPVLGGSPAVRILETQRTESTAQLAASDTERIVEYVKRGAGRFEPLRYPASPPGDDPLAAIPVRSTD